jgi:transcriptional regulator with XRE-family HTH domain
MKKVSRTKSARLAEKLLIIREGLGLSQSEMLDRLGFSDELFRSNISQYERGHREPPLPVLLKYASAAGVYVDVLIDDEIDLPARLPSHPKHEGVRRIVSSRKGKNQK